MVPNYCVILGLKLQLEHNELLRNESNSPLLFQITKHRIRILFQDIMLQENFQLTSPNPIKTHYIHRLPATCHMLEEMDAQKMMWMTGEGGSLIKGLLIPI